MYKEELDLARQVVAQKLPAHTHIVSVAATPLPNTRGIILHLKDTGGETHNIHIGSTYPTLWSALGSEDSKTHWDAQEALTQTFTQTTPPPLTNNPAPPAQPNERPQPVRNPQPHNTTQTPTAAPPHSSPSPTVTPRKSASIGKKIKAVPGTSWGLAWRLAIVFAVLPGLDMLSGFFIGALSGIVMPLLLDHRLAKKPTQALFKGKSPFTPLGRPQRTTYAYKAPTRTTPQKPAAPAVEIIEKATAPGTKTGYEPAALKQIPIPVVPFVHGTPGAGLHSSGFDSKAIDLGVAGETNFAKALTKAGHIHTHHTFWSLALPAEDRFIADPDYQSDIDCVILTENTLYLIDLKNYRQGDVTYKTHGDALYCYDNPTGKQVGKPYKTTRNMANARYRFERSLKAAGHPLQVEALVIMMPTNLGIGNTDLVSWPGDVPAYPLHRFLNILGSKAPYTRGGALVSKLEQLLLS